MQYHSDMDWKHKHWAIIITAGLIIVFTSITAWFELSNDSRTFVQTPEATTTPTVAVATTYAPQHLQEHATFYDIDLTYPASTPLASVGAQQNNAAVASMKKFAEDTAAQFKTDGNFSHLSHDDVQMMGLDQRTESLTSEYKTYTSPHTVSYVFMVYEDTLGAHPNTYYKTFTFDLRTRQLRSLGDLFTSSTYLTIVSNRARADLPGIISHMSNFAGDSDYMNEGTNPTQDNFQNFYLDNDTLVLIFPPYQVGPYAFGTILDPIPLSELRSSLNPLYIP